MPILHIDIETKAEAIIFFTIIFLPVLIPLFSYIGLLIISQWKIFVKANQPGWAAIVPFYNFYVLSKITTGNGWLFLILLIPGPNIIFFFYLQYKLALSFRKSISFALGLMFLPGVFLPILGFSKSPYLGVAIIIS